jgi:hypothetical protein
MSDTDDSSVTHQEISVHQLEFGHGCTMNTKILTQIPHIAENNFLAFIIAECVLHVICDYILVITVVLLFNCIHCFIQMILSMSSTMVYKSCCLWYFSYSNSLQYQNMKLIIMLINVITVCS